MSGWAEWVSRVTRGETSRQVGERIGHSHSTALRWMRDPSPDQVISLAVAYNADVVEALVAAGWLAEGDVGLLNLDVTLRRLSSVKLTRELYRRAVLLERVGVNTVPEPV